MEDWDRKKWSYYRGGLIIEVVLIGGSTVIDCHHRTVKAEAPCACVLTARGEAPTSRR